MRHHMMRPIAMGAPMGAMMLWMLHGVVTGDGAGGIGLLVFVAAHVAIAGVIVLGGVFAARLSAQARRWMAQVHRPSWRHMAVMMGSAVGVVALVHLSAHGFGAV